MIMAEYIRARVDDKYPKQVHLLCYAMLNPSRNSRWIVSMMNNFWKDAICAYCDQKLQCKCSIYKVTEPETGECNHAERKES